MLALPMLFYCFLKSLQYKFKMQQVERRYSNSMGRQKSEFFQKRGIAVFISFAVDGHSVF